MAKTHQSSSKFLVEALLFQVDCGTHDEFDF